MGDFVKGPVPVSLPTELAKHLRLHRRIDTYTSQSPAFQNSRRRIDPRFRYARGILVDVFYDHFLACHWEKFSDCTLQDFAQQVYRGLESCFELLPAALQRQLPSMIAHDWLSSYRKQDVVLRVLERLEVRLQQKFPLAEGIVELNRGRAELENDFFDFMQELSDAITDWR